MVPPAAPARPPAVGRVLGKVSGSVTTMVSAPGTHANTALGLMTPSFSAVAVTRHQMVEDIVLVAAWGALIPGVLWLGHAAGF